MGELDAAIEAHSETPDAAGAPQITPLTEEQKRIKGRKGTGFVPKEKLKNLLDEMSDDEETKAVQKQIIADEVTKERCKARKGTGMVTKSKLKKVLDSVGNSDD